MKVNSTGLGKTTLVTHFGELTHVAGPEPGLKMTIESTQPIHWHITVIMSSADLRQFVGIVLKPALLFHIVKILLTPTRSEPAAETKPVAAMTAKPATGTTENKATTGSRS